MRNGRQQFLREFDLFLQAAVITTCLELLWNLVLGRIPVYWLPTYSPLLAIPLNALIHILLMIILIGILGFSILLLRRKWLSKIFIPVAAAGYIYYMSCTALLRFLNLKQEFPSRGRIFLEIGLFLLIVVGTLAWWRATRLRRQRGDSLAWPATLTISTVIVLVAFFLRRPLSSQGFLILSAGVITAAHIGLWYSSRRWKPSPRLIGTGIFILTMLCVIGRGVWASRGSPGKSPNIIVLVWDAARADRMSLYGYKSLTTPGVDSLADRGILFQQAYSTANFTFPSHVSIFTGLPNRQHGLWQGTIPEIQRYFQLESVAEALKTKGYRTLLFSENPWIAYLWKGFDYYYWMDTRGVPVSACHGPVSNLKATPAAMPPFMGNCPSPFFMRQVIDQIEQACEGYYKYSVDNYGLRVLQEQLVLRGRNQPVFFFLNWMNVHNRYYPSSEHKEGKIIAPYDWSREYDRAMTYIDRRLTRLLEVLHHSGEFDRTVLILTSDHGELLGEYNLYGHVKTLFQPVLRVPFLIFHNRWARGEIIERPVSLTGLKKACEIIAAGIDDEVGTIDQLKNLFSSEPVVVAEHRTIEPRDGRYLRGWMCLDEEMNKIIFDEELPFLNSTWGKIARLVFNLKEDPKEEYNLYSSDPALSDRLNIEYQDWMLATPEALPLPDGKILPEGLKERLRGLGYLK